ncbi:GGDEF domain-containing protein [Methyloversatilis thermotolerans]|uniref:GGDEF domain-containing protein n=1 Tax=Methyloversatilis thermotolerans TaxID=1346290 RepID=UPI000363B361|nr:sensor domain-containing diguanylate cyclase [Methyloversatilis thermotolerans]
MKQAPIPEREDERLSALRAMAVLDTPPSQAFDDLTRLASALFDLPIALVSLVDSDRQWFKSVQGLCISSTRRDQAMCARTLVARDGLMVVPDLALDERFADTELARAHGVRFYAGATLYSPDSHALGAFCVMDRRPRQLDPAQQELLRALARQAQAQLQLVLRLDQLHTLASELHLRQQILEQRCVELENEASTDALTGVGSRRAAEDRLRHECAIAQRLRLPFSLCLIDVDHFKKVNDRYGHPHGDEVLRQVASLIADAARSTDYIGRWGGEEFIALLPNTDQGGAHAIAERIRRRVENGDWDRPEALTVSVGLSTFTARQPGAEHLIGLADAALYRAKAAGRNRIEAAATPGDG